MKALIKTDAYGKQHRVYRISDFALPVFPRELTTMFLIHAYVDTEFKYLVIEKVRFEGKKRCVYRTVPIHDMDDRVIHGFYANPVISVISPNHLINSLMEEFIAKRLDATSSYPWKVGSYKKQRRIIELISLFPNSTSEELLAMAERL
jgi:hypothetical protein